MARRHFNTTRSFRRSRRESQWLEVVPATNTLAAASTAVLSQSLDSAEKALRPFTVIRTRILWFVRSDQFATTENFSCAFGMAIVSDQAVAIGVTAVPTPDTDRSSDLFFAFDDVAGRLARASDVGFRELGTQRIIDSKAMRKVEEGNDLIIVQESTAISAGVESYVAGRVLIKLH